MKVMNSQDYTNSNYDKNINILNKIIIKSLL